MVTIFSERCIGNQYIFSIRQSRAEKLLVIYWYDESFTSLRVSGYKESELIQESTNKQIIDIEVLQKYQHLNEEKSLVDTVNSLALEDAQL